MLPQLAKLIQKTVQAGIEDAKAKRAIASQPKNPLDFNNIDALKPTAVSKLSGLKPLPANGDKTASLSQLKPLPPPQNTVMSPDGTKPLIDVLNEKAKAAKSFNTEDEAADFAPIQDTLGKGIGEALTTTFNIGKSALIGGLENVQDVAQWPPKMPRAVGEVGDAASKAYGAAENIMKQATLENVLKFSGETLTGGFQQLPQIAGNVASAANQVATAPVINDVLGVVMPGIPQALKMAKDRKINVSKMARETGGIGKNALKSLVKMTGLNPDSAASKAGEFTAEMVAQALLMKGLGVSGEASTKVADALSGFKNIGTQTIGRSSNPAVSALIKAGDVVSTEGPKLVDNLINSAAQTAGFSTVSKGQLPTGGQIVGTTITNRALDYLGKAAQKLAVQNFNKNVPKFKDQMGKNQSTDKVHEEMADAIRTGYVGKDAKGVEDSATAKITAYKTKTDSMIGKADETFGGVEKDSLADEAAKKLKEEAMSMSDKSALKKIDEIHAQFTGKGIEDVMKRLKEAKVNMDTQKAAITAAKRAVKEAKARGDSLAEGEALHLLNAATNSLTNVKRTLADLEKNRPFFEAAASAPKTMKLKDLEKLKQTNADINKRVVSGNKALTQEDDLRSRFFDLMAGKGTATMEEVVPGLKELFKQQNIGYKIKEAVKQEARAGAALGGGGTKARAEQMMADLFNNKGLRKLINATIAKN